MTDGLLPPYERAQLTAWRVQEETGLSAAELATLPLDEYARLTGRQTSAQAAVEAYNAAQDAMQPSQNVTGSEAAAHTPSPGGRAVLGIDLTDPAVVASMTREELLQYRDAIHRAGGIGAPRQNTGSLSGGVGRHHLVESGVDRSNLVSSRRDTDRAIQAAQQADHDRLGNWIASQRAGLGHQGVGPMRGEPMGL